MVVLFYVPSVPFTGLSSTGGLVVLLAMLVVFAPLPTPMLGLPKRSPASLAAFMMAVPKLVGSKREGSEGVEEETVLSFNAARPVTEVED